MNLFQNFSYTGQTLTTAVGISLLLCGPSNALTLEANDGFAFAGKVEITNNGDGNYDFDFLDFFTGSGQEGLNLVVTPDKFQFFDLIDITDISLPDSSTSHSEPLTDFISDILLADGSNTASFDATSFTFRPEAVDHHMIFGFTFTGLLKTSLGQVTTATGSLTSQVYLFAINEVDSQSVASFSGTLRVTDEEIPQVPTPAALLPSLLALGGVASQRTKSN